MRDFSFYGHQFTWKRSKGTLGWVEAKLDRVLILDTWGELFNQAKASSLTVLTSDHLLIHMQILPDIFPKPNSIFKFKNLWPRESICRDIMVESWGNTQGMPLLDIVRSCGKVIWNWGRESNIGSATPIPPCSSSPK